jgi:nitroreductase
MSDSKRAQDGSKDGSDGPRMGRRTFVRNLSVASLTALAAPILLEASGVQADAATPAPTTPTTVMPARMSVWEALQNRKSALTFQPQPVPQDVLLNLLWAAFGINRPDSGKRTAPSAMNCQEIDIYVLLADGAYVYDEKTNQLAAVLAQDLRTQSAAQKNLQVAPVHLLYVADYAKLSRGPQGQREVWSAAHSGFIGQNVYLYCAAEGLGARFHTSLDRTALQASLKLRDDQAIVFAQVVGYAK